MAIFIALLSCEKDDPIIHQGSSVETKKVPYSVGNITLKDFVQTTAFINEEQKLQNHGGNQLQRKGQVQDNQYQFVSNEVLSTTTDIQTTYATPIRKVNNENDGARHSLVVSQNAQGSNSYIVTYSDDGMMITISPIGEVDPDAPAPDTLCVDYSITSTTPCGCGHYHTSECGGCTSGGPLYPSSSTVGVIMICWEGPTPIGIDPPSTSYAGHGSPNGVFGGSSGGGASSPPPPPIYIYEGDAECFGDGTCTPQLYWAAQMAWLNPSGLDPTNIDSALAFTNFIATLPQEQQDFLNAPENFALRASINAFLDENNFSMELLDTIRTALESLSSFTENDYPGKNLNYDFKWWLDNSFILNSGNFDMPSEEAPTIFESPNSKELFLFSIYPGPAILHIENSAVALNKAEQLVVNGMLTGISDGKADAFRHAFWNSLGTAEFPVEIMKLFADAHEWGENGIEVDMDFYNNYKGRIIGGNFNFASSDSDISDAVLQAVFDGILKYINGQGSLVFTNQ
ncbi:hypothetical protein A9996_05255 [Gelidibacter algens]|nr:hypothetical protein A9996_05255 [Gelidibacter algens]